MVQDRQQIQIGLTANHPCSYLPEQQERVAIILDESLHSAQGYEMLIANGFRRSGEKIYRPYCENCQGCQPIRIDLQNFSPSKSQKRLLNKAAKQYQITWQIKPTMDDNWFDIYSHYINIRHKSGSMFPPNQQEFSQFATANWLNSQFLHIYSDQKLVAIAITDITNNVISAFYTFFDPDFPLSLGTLGVLLQTEYGHNNHKDWLYLGYQVDDCPAMNYKTRFQSHQKLVNQRWQG